MINNTKKQITLDEAYAAAYSILAKHGDNEMVLTAIIANLIMVKENGVIKNEMD